MNNERRADLGRDAIREAGAQTRVIEQETVETCISDVLAYVAHFCNRVGLDPYETFRAGLHSYEGDSEDGPPARRQLDGREVMWYDLPPADRVWGPV